MTAVTAELTGVGKFYGGQRAVKGVDLVLHAGECVALAGHNGAGKSTLIKLMLGLIQPNEGEVRVLGDDPATHQAAMSRMAVGYLPENVAFHPSMTGFETLAFYARLKRQPLARNSELLARVGIAQAAKRPVGTYSKGMRQRLGLAQALLGQPRLLLLDEPTTGLDPALRQVFYEILRNLRDNGTSIVLSSHALAEIEGQADRFVIMNRGEKVADGTLQDLRRAAALPVRLVIHFADARDPASLNDNWTAEGWVQVGPRRYERSCLEEDKIASIRRFAAIAGDVDDIEVLHPSLDDMYAHFLRREEE